VTESTPLVGPVLIIGCGYLGRVVARQCQRLGVPVVLTTRSEERAKRLASEFGPVVHRLDLAQADAAAHLQAVGLHAQRALVLLTPGALMDEAGGMAPLQHLCAGLATLPQLRRAVLSSSTAVYGDRAGQTVNADSACSAVSPRERRLLEIETHWLGSQGRRVVRLAGLYGPGRVIGESGLSRAQAVDGDPDGWLNLIHIHDAASLVLRCLADHAGIAPIELGSDGTPVVRRTYYEFLAARMGCRRPAFSGAPAVRGGASRRCDPRLTVERTGWRPMYRDFRVGLAAELPAPIPR